MLSIGCQADVLLCMPLFIVQVIFLQSQPNQRQRVARQARFVW